MSVGGARGPRETGPSSVSAALGAVAGGADPESGGESPLPAVPAARRPGSGALAVGLMETQLRGAEVRESARALAVELRAGRGEALVARTVETLAAGLPDEPRARLALVEAAFGAGGAESRSASVEGSAGAVAFDLWQGCRARGTLPKLAALLERVAAGDLPGAASSGLPRLAPDALERARALAASVERERDVKGPLLRDVTEVFAAACGNGPDERRAFAERALGGAAKSWTGVSLHESPRNFAHDLARQIEAHLGPAGIAAALRSLGDAPPPRDPAADAARAHAAAKLLDAAPGAGPTGPELKPVAEALAPLLAAEPRARGVALADALGERAALVHEIPLDVSPAETAYELLTALRAGGETGRLPGILRALADGTPPAPGTGAALAFAPADPAAAAALAGRIERATALDGPTLRAAAKLLAGAFGCSHFERGAFLARAIGDTSLLAEIPGGAPATRAAFEALNVLASKGRLDQAAALLRAAAA